MVCKVKVRYRFLLTVFSDFILQVFNVKIEWQ